MERQGEYRIIEQTPREGGGTVVRYITGYGKEATLRTLKENPADIRKTIERFEAYDYGDRNASPEDTYSPSLRLKMQGGWPLPGEE